MFINVTVIFVKIGHNNSINTLYLSFLFRHCRLYPLFSIYDTLNIRQKPQLTIDGFDFFTMAGDYALEEKVVCGFKGWKLHFLLPAPAIGRFTSITNAFYRCSD